MSFSFFEDPEVSDLFRDIDNSLATADNDSVANAWTDYFRSETADMLQSVNPVDNDDITLTTAEMLDQHNIRSLACSPADSGVSEMYNFDIDNAFILGNDSDDVMMMRPEDFEAEVDFMFNRKQPSLAPSHGIGGLEFDVDIENLLEAEQSEDKIVEATDEEELSKPAKEVATESVEEEEEEKAEEGSEEAKTSQAAVTLPLSERRSTSRHRRTEAAVSSATNAASVTPTAAPDAIHSYSAKPKVAVKQIRTALRNNTTRSRAAKATARKRKLYEVDAPLANPEMEKCRINAINAKKNRDRKKQQLEEAELEIKRLRRENTELIEEVQTVREEMEELRAEMAAMRQEFKAAGMPLGKRRKVC